MLFLGMLEKGHVIEVLEKAEKAIKNEDVSEIKELSNQTLHSASIYQDADNISLAVVLYSLSKIIERTSYKEEKGWADFKKNYTTCLSRAKLALKAEDIEVYRDQIACIREHIGKLSGDLKKYIEDVFRKAQINKASRLYEHGLSLEKTAKILGVTIWELNQYVGRTGIADVNYAYTKELEDRIKLAQDIFKK